MSTRTLWLGFLVALLLVACQGEKGPEAAPVNGTTTIAEPTRPAAAATAPTAKARPALTVESTPRATPIQEATMTPAASPPPGSNPFVDEAIEDLAQRLGIPAAEVELISFEAVVWPDSSLGCPLPGAAYVEVVTPGFLIHCRAEGQELSVHTDTVGHAVLCKGGEPQLPPIPVTPGEIKDGDPWLPVDPPPEERTAP